MSETTNTAATEQISQSTTSITDITAMSAMSDNPAGVLAFFAPCPRGLEALLVEELQEIAAGAADATLGNIVATGGGVHFTGQWADCYRVNLYSGLASRVLWKLHHFGYKTEDDLYQQTVGMPWESWFDLDASIKVTVAAQRCPLKSLNFVTFRIKDAICDRFRQMKHGQRPNVDMRDPDMRVQVFLTSNECTLLIDTSGQPLWKRGWRTAVAEAPLKENLACGMIKLAGWQPDQPFVDPMCGSGTLLMEAIALACRIPPGAKRHFAFEKLTGFNPQLWSKIKSDATNGIIKRQDLTIIGCDISASALAMARENIRCFGWQDAVQFYQQPIETLTPELIGNPPPGTLLTNPPYGVRIGEDVELMALYPAIGDTLKRHFCNWQCYFLTADSQFPKLIGLRANRKYPLWNGPLDCRLYTYKMVAGSNRRVGNQNAEANISA